ncbi:DUF2971 domain-containing protein [Maridesulfovibrio ferrireducens]|uniref:DUF2971 domain-containing protein n=1 Tax=Maridesulfovibrio ferrireducens TaxID=246191 RepID=UPI001A2BB306|nr:DUF2971 domain-containing protein [Maridesulfovibrio ferrireducens]MBI9113333.1 DUF2971 domain-containing protein [Maridesulfovibrio ferrireducens]
MIVPDILYKYTTASTAKIVLESSRLRWSSLGYFNDPNEFQRLPVFDPDIDECYEEYIQLIVKIALCEDRPTNWDQFNPLTVLLIEMLKAALLKGVTPESLQAELVSVPQKKVNYELIREYVDNVDTKSARVFCLTTEYSNNVMWASYAQGHTGCVLGFRHLVEKNTPFLAANPIDYTKGPPTLDSGLDFLLYKPTAELRKKIHLAICYSKDEEWAYEEEWRVITWREEEGERDYGDYTFYEEELESVTLGSSMDHDESVEIIDLVRSRYERCSVYRMEHIKGRSVRNLVYDAE